MNDRLAPAARAAVLGFLGAEADLTPLAQGPAHTYRVDAGTERYVLRVHAPEKPEFEPTFSGRRELESECTWLAALAAETDLTAPVPLPAPGGGHVLDVRATDTADPVPCTMLCWVEGELVEGRRTPEQARKLGELLVALHEHASGWTPPPDFARPRIDRAWTHEAVRRLEGLASADVIAAKQVAVLAAAVDMLVLELEPLDDDPARVGLIHADLHESNYVFHEGEARPIDFARAGWGTWLNDVSESLQHLYPDRRRDLVEAYSALRPLDDADLRRLEGYLIAAAVEGYGYHSPDPANHAGIARSVAYFADKHTRRYLDGQPFMFEF